MTTGQLIEALKQFDKDTPVVLYYSEPERNLSAKKISNIKVIGLDSKNNTDIAIEYEKADLCIIG